MSVDPSTLVPPPDPVALPLPIAVVKVLLLASFGLHILAVDLGVGGSIVALVLAHRGKSSPPHLQLARVVSKVLPATVTFAITLGVAPLLFAQVLYGRFLYVSSILMWLPWVSFIAALIAGYALLYRFVDRLEKGGPSIATGIVSTLLLLWLGFLWTNNVTLMLRPEHWAQIAATAPHGGALNLGDPQVLPRFLHMVVAMTAVAALFLGTAGALAPENVGFDRALARRFGLKAFAHATFLQLLIGPLVVWFQPEDVRAALLGGSIRATGALAVAVPSALIAAVMALRGADPKAGRSGALVPFVLIHVTVAGMVVLRDAVRDLTLARVGFDVGQTSVAVDVGATAAFAVAAIVLGLCLWAMFRWLQEGRTGVAKVRAPAPAEEVDHEA